MNDIQLHTNKYLDYCSHQKRLDKKTITAYHIDLEQFVGYISETQLTDITQDTLELYISYIHQNYQPKTVKRKIASLKAMFHYFEYKGLITQKPFSKMQIRFREPIILLKTIPLHTVEHLLKAYSQQTNAKTAYQRKNAIRDAAVCELLFATGMRISELCSLNVNDVNLQDETVLIFGKGSKERQLQLGNKDVITTLENYKNEFFAEIANCHRNIFPPVKMNCQNEI